MDTCEKCGISLVEPGLEGLCGRCLIVEGLTSEGDAPDIGFEAVEGLNPTGISSGPQSFGDYDLLHEVARGGMGVVYRARQRSLGRIVAVKVMSSGEFASAEGIRRFQAEAEATARLRHPGIVSIHEVGCHEGIRYFSMEFVEGRNLARELDGKPLRPGAAADLLRKVAEAVQHAHDHGILHRDLKPSNILIDPDDQPRVTDFGLARDLTEHSDLTLTGQVLGTPGYLPPEQADPRCGAVTQASDVYSLGAVLYFMLTARAPFAAGSLQETLRQVLSEEPVSPRMLNPEVPRDLETICLKCLERDPLRRYATAAALVCDLERFRDGEPILARPLSAPDRFLRWCHRRPALATVWLLVMTLAVGSTVASFWIGRARSLAEDSASKARAAQAAGRERLREARVAQARAIRRTSVPGRRTQALEALAEAVQIRPGEDLRDEAVAALLLTDVREVERWNLNPGSPVGIPFDSSGRMAALQYKGVDGFSEVPSPLRSWGSSTGRTTIATPPGIQAVSALRFSPDSRHVVARYSDNTVRVWRVGDGTAELTLSHNPPPRPDQPGGAFNDDYDFNLDGSLLAIGAPGGGMSLHRIPDGVEQARLTWPHRFNIVRVSPDGTRVAAATISEPAARSVVVLKLPSLDIERRIEMATSIGGFAWSSDSRLLVVATQDGMVSLVDLFDGRLLRRIVRPGPDVGGLVFLGHDQFVAVPGLATMVRLENLTTGAEELVLSGVSSPTPVAPSSGDAFVISSTMGVATRYQLQLPIGLRTLMSPHSAGYPIAWNNCSLDFTPDGRWLAAAYGRYTILQDAESGRLVEELDSGDRKTREYSTVAFTENGRALLRCSTLTGINRLPLKFDAAGRPHFGPAELLNSETGHLISDHVADGHRLLLIHPESAGVKVLDVDAGIARTVSSWKVPDVYSGAFSPDRSLVLINPAGLGTNAAGLHPALYRVADGTLVRELPDRASSDVSWSTDGAIALTSNGQTRSVIWNTADWTPRAVLDGAIGGDTTTFALSLDGAYAVISRDQTIHIVSPAGRILTRFDLSETTGLAAGIRFLHDGKRFAIHWRDGRIDLIEPEALRRNLAGIGLAW